MKKQSSIDQHSAKDIIESLITSQPPPQKSDKLLESFVLDENSPRGSDMNSTPRKDKTSKSLKATLLLNIQNLQVKQHNDHITECQTVSVTASTVNNVNDNETIESPFRCRRCELSFATKASYQEHTKYSKIHQLNVIENNSVTSQNSVNKIAMKPPSSSDLSRYGAMREASSDDLRKELIRRLSVSQSSQRSFTSPLNSTSITNLARNFSNENIDMNS